ncbi:MAG: hypothetical protein GOVbin3205_42 [Prokaryotic dsDNA virus sp.]|nr:MAG: hypothetical protein GOVbin3205_42 [Prokaryotic dsDNA virus sp.]|tara:strand:- start:115 stop:597 length:483 start_codon:yes stop_codon:yes gene_type:complete
MKVTTIIPSKMLEYQAKNGYHIQMNRNYTATVRNLMEFKKYINRPDTDINLEVFGNILSYDSTVDEDFKYVLNSIIAEVKGFAVFNAQFNHTYIECKNSNETISIKTSNGKLITFSVMYNQCVDVKYHNGKDDFKIIGFHFGQTPVPHTDVTLQTVLLNN